MVSAQDESLPAYAVPTSVDGGCIRTVNRKRSAVHVSCPCSPQWQLHAVSVSYEERSRPDKAGVDSSMLSLGTTSPSLQHITEIQLPPAHSAEHGFSTISLFRLIGSPHSWANHPSLLTRPSVPPALGHCPTPSRHTPSGRTSTPGRQAWEPRSGMRGCPRRTTGRIRQRSRRLRRATSAGQGLAEHWREGCRKTALTDISLHSTSHHSTSVDIQGPSPFDGAALPFSHVPATEMHVAVPR